MIDDRDIWCAANPLLKRYRADAAVQAAQRAPELLDAGGVDGCAIWKRILEAVADLARKARLAEVARRIVARRETAISRLLLAPLGPHIRELEEGAETDRGSRPGTATRSGPLPSLIVTIGA